MTGWVIVGKRLKDFFVSQSLDIHSCHSVPASSLTLSSQAFLKVYLFDFFFFFTFYSHLWRRFPSGNRGAIGETLGWCFWKLHTSFCSVCRFRSCLTSIFIHGKYNNECSCRSQLLLVSLPLSMCVCVALPLLPSLFDPLPLSVPHCQCREHSHGYRPQHGNTQQTRKMTASAISFSEGLQVRQEMAIIPSTLSVLSYFLL